ncbi:MAG: Mut7-C ubiquitin/RNAse domain-containing protein [Chloroflexi bacterium]|nr:Mut7-C ubiquitin/RNAse domain-containing protein [Chloroflexota bacterium]
MKTARFHFHGDLAELLRNRQSGKLFDYSFQEAQTVKHLIESAGIPHTEAAAILANGQPVNFNYLVQDGDRIGVYPPTAVPPQAPSLQPPPPRPIRFLLDNHLGKLTRYLRLLGFDALYPPDHLTDAELVQLAHDQQRVMLTRDRGLLMHKRIAHGCLLRSKETTEQVTAVLQRYDLYDEISPWQRCLRCNGRLRPVPKADILDRLEPKTKLYYEDFQICQECGQIYWKGSHFASLEEWIAQVTRRQA